MLHKKAFLYSLFIASATGLSAQNTSLQTGTTRLLRFDQTPTRHTVPGCFLKAVSADSDATITNAYEFGTLAAEDGSTWFYTSSFGESTEFPYCYGSADFEIYDSSNKKVATLHYDVPAGSKVNAIEPFGAVSSKFYDTNSRTQEFTIYVHEVGADYTSIGHILVYNNNGELVRQYEADNLVWVDASEKWNSYQRAILMNSSTDESGNKTTTLSVLKPASWSSASPTVEHTFTLSDALTEYSNGPSLNTYVIDGNLYYVLSHYELPYVSGYDRNYDMIIQQGNHYFIQVFDKDYQQVADLSIPVTHPDDVYCSLYSVGLYSHQDLCRGTFTGDDQFNLIVTRTDVRLDTDDDTYPNAFLVFDQQGNQVQTIANNVTSWKQLQNIPGQPDQVGCICLNDGNMSLQMINLPDCSLQTEFPATLADDRRISTDYDRYPVNGTYQYAIGMGNATTNDHYDVISSIGWFTNEGTLDHFVDFNLGQNGEFFTPLIEGYTLNPALFNTDDAREYIYIAKIRRQDGSEVIDNVLIIADQQGNEIQRYIGDDSRTMRIAAVLDTEIRKPRLVVGYSDNHTGNYDIDFYTLPFTKFAEGGDGTISNPYQIASAGDLFQVAAEPNAHYSLARDIDMATIAEPWLPVSSFGGQINGNGHTVSHLYLKSNDSYTGLFGYMNEGARLTDITFSDALMRLTRGNSYAGLVAGMSIKAQIDSVMIQGFEVTADANANSEFGGLVGQATYYSLLAANSITEADYHLPSCSSVGGLVGSTRTGTTIEACLFTGSALAANKLGGLVGTSGKDCSIQNCHVNASLQALTNVGGLVADASRSLTTHNLVEGSLTATSVDMYGNACVGGVAGQIESDWTSSDTQYFIGNIVALNSISAPAEATAVHRIAGFTIADEQYEEEEVHKTELGLSNNYAAESLVLSASIPEDTKQANKVDGADFSSLSRSFLEGLGFVYGNSIQAPWAGEEMPYLFFEKEGFSDLIAPISSSPASTSDLIYDLSGHRVSTMNHGIYLVGGKKILR